MPRAGGRKRPSRSNSANNKTDSCSCLTTPWACSSAVAMARSRGRPPLGICAGTKLKSTRAFGNGNPNAANADGNLSRASLAGISGMPTSSVLGKPRLNKTSTRTNSAWPPKSAAPKMFAFTLEGRFGSPMVTKNSRRQGKRGGAGSFPFNATRLQLRSDWQREVF